MSCPTVTYQLLGTCRNSHAAVKYVAADLRVCDFCINTHSGATPPSRVNLLIFNRVCKNAYGILAHSLHICPPRSCHPEESLSCHPRNPSPCHPEESLPCHPEERSDEGSKNNHKS